MNGPHRTHIYHHRDSTKTRRSSMPSTASSKSSLLHRPWRLVRDCAQYNTSLLAFYLVLANLQLYLHSSVHAQLIGEKDHERCPDPDNPQIITKSTGRLTSSNYPSPYTGNENCSWIISPPTGYVVRLTVLEAIMENIANKAECMDELEISDPENGVLVDSLCKQERPVTYVKFLIIIRVEWSIFREGL